MLGQLSTFLETLLVFYDLKLLRRGRSMSELHFMSLEELDNELKKSDSGIYFIKDYNDNIIYVGKAFSIK
ncbi:nucleotide excision repair endonuclease, partial [Bacillus toyonensis]